MAPRQQLLDRFGNPVRRETLTREVGAPTISGVRSPISGYPADGMDPVRLAQILRAADHGEAVRYFELAEQIEERDPHYLGVISTRKRSVSQIDVTVDSASDAPQDVRMADMVRDWLDRDELTADLFNILDCIGKGVSFTEIGWEVSERQWRPASLKRRDPRHYRWARHDLETPLMLDDTGREVPLEPYRFIYASIAAKSGLPLRSGLARVAAWGWMFKAFTQRDWAIFTQTYGQPIRLGKWHQGASEEDKNTLFQAVANIAGDCAAIIPDSMSLEFIESKSIGASSDLFERRTNWIDQQISKAVLGQTATTDAIAGGHAVGREHREVQEDIETADAKALAAILNRDLIRPWIDLEFGPQKRYPRLRIARPQQEDLKQLTESLKVLVPLGLRVSESEVRDKLGLADPKPEDRLLGAPSAPKDAPDADATDPSKRTSIFKAVSEKFKRVEPLPGVQVAPQAEGPSAALTEPLGIEALLTDRMLVEADPEMARMLQTIGRIIDASGSLEEAREMLIAAYPEIGSTGLGARLAQGLIAAWAVGRAEVVDEDG
jgi:phage gp29-like protein